jgi:hypothetical protein
VLFYKQINGTYATKMDKQFNLLIAYNGAADTASWNDMKAFLESVFTH